MEMTEWIFWMILGSVVGLVLGCILNSMYPKKWIVPGCMIVFMGMTPNIAVLFLAPNFFGGAPLTVAVRPKTADELADTTISMLENKSTAYKLLLKFEPQFRSELHAIIKSSNNFRDTDDVEPLLKLFHAKLFKYLPYADDKVVAKFAAQKVSLFSYTEKFDAASCEALINSRFAKLHIPSDMFSKLRNVESNLFASGIEGFKSGNKEKLAFTSKELDAYLVEIEKFSDTFNRADFLKVLDEKANPQEQCKAFSSLSDFVKKENSENIARFWRTLVLGVRD